MANILTLIFSFGQVGPAPAPSGAYRVNNFDSLSKIWLFWRLCEIDTTYRKSDFCTRKKPDRIDGWHFLFFVYILTAGP